MARRDDRRSGPTAREMPKRPPAAGTTGALSAAENQEASRELAPRDATRPGAKRQLRGDTGRNGTRKR